MPSWVLGSSAERASTIDGLDLNALGLDLSSRGRDERPDGPLSIAAKHTVLGSISHSIVSCHLFLGSRNAATCPLPSSLPSGQTAPFGSMQGAGRCCLCWYLLARNGRSKLIFVSKMIAQRYEHSHFYLNKHTIESSSAMNE